MGTTAKVIASAAISASVLVVAVSPANSVQSPAPQATTATPSHDNTRLDVGEIMDVGQHVTSSDGQSQFGLEASWLNPDWKTTAFVFTSASHGTWRVGPKLASPGSTRAVMTLDAQGDLIQQNTNEGGHTFIQWRTSNSNAFARKGRGIPHLAITNGGKTQIIVERSDKTSYVLWEDGKTVE